MMASRPRRRTTTYYGEDTDTEEDCRPTRGTRTRPNYADTSSDDEGADFAHSDLEPLPRILLPPRTTAKSTKRKARTTRSTPDSSHKRRKVLGAPLKQNPGSKSETMPFVQPGRKIPPWQTLEHDILTSILRFASQPLHLDYLRPSASVQWLLGVSCLSRSWHDAAVAALMHCPPLVPYGSDLLHLLKQTPENLSTNYRVKPRKLVVEAKHLLVKKGGKISLPELVSKTPLLVSLRIVSHYDELKALWAHPSYAKKTYLYEARLFDVLESSCPRLKEFEWNGRFASALPDLIDTVSSAHARLSGLSSIGLMNINFPEKSTAEERKSQQEQMLSALKKLSHLAYLRITNCDILGDFGNLASLDSSLKSLEINDCPSLTSSGLQKFLTNGNQLEQLHLAGCQTCDGAFLPRLSHLCPQLQVLELDLTYHDSTSYHDIHPLFDDFLPNGAISFPSTLIELDINNLRKVNPTQFESCMNSLIASDLPNLRKLSIKAIITTSDYRVRAGIRTRWTEKLENVFLRRSAPPASSLQVQIDMSARRKQPWSESSARSTSDESKKRHSSRISVLSRSAAPQNSSTESRTEDVVACMQGLCDLVVFRVDDQRPAESQYVFSDFLDDEVSGDEDYND